METKEMTCIVCPKGCRIKAEIDNGKIIKIEGWSCKRGLEYANAEIFHPTRILTSTVKTSNGSVIPVKTSKPIPKEKIFDCMKLINQQTISLTIRSGDVIIKNILDTGADIIATANYHV